MLVAQAHSFASQSRLAITLSWVAGYTNILGLILCAHPTSHISGTAAQLGQSLVEYRTHSELIRTLLVLLICFVLGAGVSGALTELGRKRGWNSIYVLPMAVEMLLLSMVALTIELGGRENLSYTAQLIVMCSASAAMGLQNATITRISSGVVRTTHVTGVVTDIGSEAAHLLWSFFDRTPVNADPVGHRASRLRLLLLVSIFASFTFGAALATVFYDFARAFVVYPPVLFLLWIIYVDSTQPIAEIEAVPDHGGDIDLPPGIAVFHVKQASKRRGRKHRLPNLIAWAERLSPDVRVVVLDLDRVAELDHNAVLEIRQMLVLLRAGGRRLVLAGITGEQYNQLERVGITDMLDPIAVHADFDLALARGLTLLHEP